MGEREKEVRKGKKRERREGEGGGSGRVKATKHVEEVMVLMHLNICLFFCGC